MGQIRGKLFTALYQKGGKCLLKTLNRKYNTCVKGYGI